MTEISRTEAITFISYLQFAFLSKEERAKISETALLEKEGEGMPITDAGLVLRQYIEHKISRYTNLYLQEFLYDTLQVKFTITGTDKTLFACPCCSYQTLDKRGEYDICAVCFWEDDGNSTDDAYSAVNHMTLQDAKENFRNIGAISGSCMQLLHRDRLRMFKC